MKNTLILFFSLSVVSSFAQKTRSIEGTSVLPQTFDLSQVKADTRMDLDFDVAKAADQGRNFALIISVGDYKDKRIKDLTEPQHDALILKNTLQGYYTFEDSTTILLNNPTRSQMIRAFDQLAEKINTQDNILIFYAGHGYWDESLKQGYWLPSDAAAPADRDKSNWFSNSNLRDYIQGFKATHTLLIADACFSGGIFATRNLPGAPKAVQELYRLPSRKAMTSGALSEVPDKSVFLEYLCEKLRDNKNPYLPSEQLFYSFKIDVINNSTKSQVPQFGEISGSGDKGGDYIFIKRKK